MKKILISLFIVLPLLCTTALSVGRYEPETDSPCAQECRRKSDALGGNEKIYNYCVRGCLSHDVELNRLTCLRQYGTYYSDYCKNLADCEDYWEHHNPAGFTRDEYIQQCIKPSIENPTK